MAVVCQKKAETEEIVYVPPVQSVLMQKSNDLVKQFSKYADAIGLSPKRSMYPTCNSCSLRTYGLLCYVVSL